MIYTVTLNPSLDRTLIVPRLELNDVLRAQETRLDWGGKGFNVSRALLALGESSTAMGFVGGETGRRMEAGLNTLGIPTDFVYTAAESRTNIVIMEAGTGQHIKVNEKGPAASPLEQEALFVKVGQKAQPGDFWLFCGSLPPGVEPDFYARLIQQVQNRGAKACLDTSGPALRLGLQARPFLIKPNRSEAEELAEVQLKIEADLCRAAGSFMQQGVQHAAISLGGEGLWLSARTQAAIINVHAHPPAVDIQNPTGAGDALLAGLLWALQNGWKLEEAARWGVATGTSAALKAGVEFGSRQEVEEIYARTFARRIA